MQFYWLEHVSVININIKMATNNLKSTHLFCFSNKYHMLLLLEGDFQDLVWLSTYLLFMSTFHILGQSHPPLLSGWLCSTGWVLAWCETLTYPPLIEHSLNQAVVLVPSSTSRSWYPWIGCRCFWPWEDLLQVLLLHYPVHNGQPRSPHLVWHSVISPGLEGWGLSALAHVPFSLFQLCEDWQTSCGIADLIVTFRCIFQTKQCPDK